MSVPLKLEQLATMVTCHCIQLSHKQIIKAVVVCLNLHSTYLIDKNYSVMSMIKDKGGE